jgi:hypothetical protein
MLTETFSLILTLPPLAFGPAQPNPWAPPRLLTCDIRELWQPAAAQAASRPIPNLPRFSTPRTPRPHLLGPRLDAAIWEIGRLLVGATGGNVDIRPPEARRQAVPQP